MFGKPKAKGLDVMTAVGKKPKPDLSDPDSLDEKPMPKMAEEAETPEHEGAEEYGAKMMADLEAAGEANGLDAATTRKVAASFFGAMAKCLGGEEPAEEVNESDTEDYPA
jgi:hypothetical protein